MRMRNGTCAPQLSPHATQWKGGVDRRASALSGRVQTSLAICTRWYFIQNKWKLGWEAIQRRKSQNL